MATIKPLPPSRKRLNLGDDDDDDDDDGDKSKKPPTQVKPTKKRVNPFKLAAAAAKPPTSKQPQPQPPLPLPKAPIPHPPPPPGDGASSPAAPPGDDDTDDYLSMPLTSLPAPPPQPETYTQRRLRLSRESESRARTPSKAELAALEHQRREEGLARSLLEDTGSRGWMMMRKMGWRGEGGLGRQLPTTLTPPAAEPEGGEEDGEEDPARGGLGFPPPLPPPPPTPPAPPPPTQRQPITEPLALTIKPDRSGIGHLSSSQQKFRSSLPPSLLPSSSPSSHPSHPQQPQESAESYRARLTHTRAAARAEAQFYSAQGILEGFDRDRGGRDADSNPPHPPKDVSAGLPRTVPLASIPLLYRSLVAHREEKERKRRQRYEFTESLASASLGLGHHGLSLKLPGYERDPEEGVLFGITSPTAMVEDDGAEEDDEELEGFNQVPFTERLGLIVAELRDRWGYCFWCKYRYGSREEMDEACPGVDEDVHG